MPNTQDNKALVYIVDDDPMMRVFVEDVARSVQLDAAGFSSAQDFLDEFQPDDRPCCLVLDVSMPGMSGIELQKRLAADDVQTPIVMMTAHAEVPTAVAAMEAGAFGFIEKPPSHMKVLEKIQGAIAKDHRRLEQAQQAAEIKDRLDTLSAREREVMNALVAGKTTKAVARSLGISPKTVESHRANVLEKMDVESVVDLTREVTAFRALAAATKSDG